jgi:hypothetical protein
MLTRMEEEDLKLKYAKLELDRQKLSTTGDAIDAPTGSSLEDIMRNALDKYDKAKEEYANPYANPEYKDLKPMVKTSNTELNRDLTVEGKKAKRSLKAKETRKLKGKENE